MLLNLSFNEWIISSDKLWMAKHIESFSFVQIHLNFWRIRVLYVLCNDRDLFVGHLAKRKKMIQRCMKKNIWVENIQVFLPKDILHYLNSSCNKTWSHLCLFRYLNVKLQKHNVVNHLQQLHKLNLPPTDLTNMIMMF